VSTVSFTPEVKLDTIEHIWSWCPLSIPKLHPMYKLVTSESLSDMSCTLLHHASAQCSKRVVRCSMLEFENRNSQHPASGARPMAMHRQPGFGGCSPHFSLTHPWQTPAITSLTLGSTRPSIIHQALLFSSCVTHHPSSDTMDA
jgi:hypothetical protein